MNNNFQLEWSRQPAKSILTYTILVCYSSRFPFFQPSDTLVISNSHISAATIPSSITSHFKTDVALPIILFLSPFIHTTQVSEDFFVFREQKNMKILNYWLCWKQHHLYSQSYVHIYFIFFTWIKWLRLCYVNAILLILDLYLPLYAMYSIYKSGDLVVVVVVTHFHLIWFSK